MCQLATPSLVSLINPIENKLTSKRNADKMEPQRRERATNARHRQTSLRRETTSKSKGEQHSIHSFI